MKQNKEWRPVVGYEGLYEVSNYGDVYNIKRNHMMKPNDRDGYKIVRLSKNGARYETGAHRLVAQAFIPNPNNYPVVNHKDENPSNNNVDNLEWCTVGYNNTYNNKHITTGHKLRFNKLNISEEGRQRKIETNRTRKVTDEQKRKTSESLKQYYKTKKEFDELEKQGYVRGVTYEKRIYKY